MNRRRVNRALKGSYKTLDDLLIDVMVLRAAIDISESIPLDKQTNIVENVREKIRKTLSKSLRTKNPLAKFAMEHKLSLLDFDIICASALAGRRVHLDSVCQKLHLLRYSQVHSPQLEDAVKGSNAVKGGLVDIKEATQGLPSLKRRESAPERVLHSDFPRLFSALKEHPPDLLNYGPLYDIYHEFYFLQMLHSKAHRHDSRTLKKLFSYVKHSIFSNLAKARHSRLKGLYKKYGLSDEEVLFLLVAIPTEGAQKEGAGRLLEKLGFAEPGGTNLEKHNLVFRVGSSRPRYVVSIKARSEIFGFEYTENGREEDAEFERGGEFLRVINGSRTSPLVSEIPKTSFDDVVLPEKKFWQIKNTISQLENKGLIFDEWGLGQSIQYGKGICMCFSGPPGTGKTMTAKAIANSLKQRLLVVDYSKLYDKYVGESEKSVANIFKAAEKQKSVLFFDEADAVAFNRQNAERVWETSIVDVLLKELENFEGVCIFSTNMVNKFDPAFERRLSLHVSFEAPDYEGRVKIFERHFPKREALGADVDFSVVARSHTFSGGDIKNAVLNAARIAANDPENKERRIFMRHIEAGCRTVAEGREINRQTKSAKELGYFG